jgi:uncharacterized repeat protein (TIGR03803 family)
MTLGMRAFRLQLLGPHRRAWLAPLVAIASCLLAIPVASAQGLNVLYCFSPTNAGGVAPSSRLILGSDGNLYGTTLGGGANGAGSIFSMTTNGSLSNLYSFAAATNNSGAISYDLEPNELIQGSNGNFYGTTRRAGSNFDGTIFEISSDGFFTNLHTFGSEAANADGAVPAGAMVQGSDGNFYGTTQYGGSNGTGTIFRLSPSGAFTNLYSFRPAVTGVASTNGSVPNALVVATNGAFYGTTQQGGLGNAGTFFTFSLGGSVTQVFSFNGNAPGQNPVAPNSALAQGANGSFYGTSSLGGSQGGGCIYEITITNSVRVLHSFPLFNAGAGSALTLGADGNFYGTTAAKALNGNGTLFRVTPQGNFGAYQFSGLNTNGDNPDGANPSPGLAADSLGNLYGTCAAGGTNGSGLIFQISDTNFVPAFFASASNPPPALTNVLVGSSVTLSDFADGIPSLSYQWLKDGTNLTDGGDILGSQTNTLLISPVLPDDVGSYALVISNLWGSLTSSVTLLTVDTPGISISSPVPNARTNLLVFAGTATNAPYTNVSPGQVQLVSVIFSISNLVNGSNITGMAPVKMGSNWSFTAALFPGSNVLSVQSVDFSGNVSPAQSRSFFYEVPAPLTVLATGSGIGTFTITNGAMLNIGENYSITAKPVASVFNSWTSDAIQSFFPTLPFVMQSNLVVTADFSARQSPAVSITYPAAKARISSPVFAGTATSVPVLAGVNPANVQLTNVAYWFTNIATGSNFSGVAVLTNGAAVSNWSITAIPWPGANVLAVQSQDISGDVSPIVYRSFFYEVPAVFILSTAGTGSGTFTATAAVPGDALPTNGAMLNLGENYTITAKPDPFSVFSQWVISTGVSNSSPTLPFVMQAGLALTAVFNAKPPLVAISSPAANLRTAAPAFNGTASSGLGLSNVSYSLANAFAGSLTNGFATLTAGAGMVSNWSIAIVPLPGTNILTVQSIDVAGDISASASRTFFYKVASVFTLSNGGIGNGTFTSTAGVPGDILPTNGAMLNLGEGYTITAKPDKFSVFSQWITPNGNISSPKLPFIMQAGYALTAAFGAAPPVVAISSPSANLRTPAPVLSGTASSHFGLTNVTYSLTNTFTGSVSNGFATLTAGTGTVSNWSAEVVPLPGTNILTVQSMDVAGDSSASVSRTFFYEVPAELEILRAGTGNGTLTGAASIPGVFVPSNGAMLNVGESYAITAKPDKSSLFSNWISAAGVTLNPTLNFIMQSNLQLTVTFATNFFISAAGAYNGLFYPDEGIAEETSGMLYNLALRNTGAFSGALLIAGGHYSFSSNFNISGEAAFNAGPLQVDLNLDSTNLQITGTVSTSQWTANLIANVASNALSSAEYTMIFSASTNVSADSPPGDGYALITNHAGMLTLSGALADGASFNQSVPLSQTADVPVYAVLYTNIPHAAPGLLLGWINLTNLQAEASTNQLTWIKKAIPLPALYTNGFTNILSGQGSPWTNPPAISLTNANLVISNTDVFLNFTNVFVTNNTLTNLSGLPTNFLTGSINPKTGLLALTFGNGNGKATNRGTGTLLQNTTNAGGFFLTPTNAGSFILQP